MGEPGIGGPGEEYANPVKPEKQEPNGEDVVGRLRQEARQAPRPEPVPYTEPKKPSRLKEAFKRVIGRPGRHYSWNQEPSAIAELARQRAQLSEKPVHEEVAEREDEMRRRGRVSSELDNRL